MHDSYGNLHSALIAAANFGGCVDSRMVSGVIIIRSDGTVEGGDAPVVGEDTPQSTPNDELLREPRLEIMSGESEAERNARRLRELETVITGF